jgi:ubiquitin
VASKDTGMASKPKTNKRNNKNRFHNEHPFQLGHKSYFGLCKLFLLRFFKIKVEHAELQAKLASGEVDEVEYQEELMELNKELLEEKEEIVEEVGKALTKAK